MIQEKHEEGADYHLYMGYGTVTVLESGQVKLATVTNNKWHCVPNIEHCEIWRALGPPYKSRDVMRGTATYQIFYFDQTSASSPTV